MGRISTTEAARRHGVSAQTIRRWIASGKLRGVRDNHGNMLVEDVAPPAPYVATSVATPVATPEMMPVSVHLAMMARRDADIEAERQRHTDEIVRLRAKHVRERRIDQLFAWMVIAAGIAVIAIVGPVVWR